MRRLLQLTLAASAFAGGLQLLPVTQTAAQAVESLCPTCRQAEYGQPDLFRNYYVDPTCGGMGAQMYLAPGPVPAHVGHTYYTYQPLMPHELLYKHKRAYHRYYDEGRGLTRTHVRWW